MSTRGLYGFRKNGNDKTTYNHWDSYPDGLGQTVVNFIMNTTVEQMNNIYDNIILVDSDTKPTQQQINECGRYANTTVSSGELDEWYVLLREAQGNLEAFKSGLRYIIDSSGFILDSVWCEYGYIINLDTNNLEFWFGFQEEPDNTNRYGQECFESGSGTKFYPCKFIAEFTLSEVNSNTVEMMNILSNEDYEENENECVPLF